MQAIRTHDRADGGGDPVAAPAQAAERPVRRWQDVVELCQVDIAEALTREIGAGRFDRACYQNWLAMESVACRIGALSLDAVAEWHGAQPALQATARLWACDLREDAQVAARDVRVLDGMAASPPPPLAQWHAFANAAGASQRAGEALGAVLLHSCLFDGAMRPAVATLGLLPFTRGSHYLQRRLQSAYARDPECAALLDAYAATALAVGAQRAAGWYRDALAMALR